MARFGGNEFHGFSVPLAFEGRYFILEPGDPPRLTVVKEQDGLPILEVLRNEPMENPFSDVTKTPPGIVTVSDKSSGRFLYKVRPGSETSVVFGMLKGSDISARITDRNIEIGGSTLENNVFKGQWVGAQVSSNSHIAICASIPPVVREWLK